MRRFSETFKQALADHGWKTRHYGQQTGIIQSTLSRWLRGTVVPSTNTLPALIAPFRDTTKAALLCAYLQDIADAIKPGLFTITQNNNPPTAEARTDTFPEGISEELRGQLYRIAEKARDTPEIAAIVHYSARLSSRPWCK